MKCLACQKTIGNDDCLRIMEGYIHVGCFPLFDAQKPMSFSGEDAEAMNLTKYNGMEISIVSFIRPLVSSGEMMILRNIPSCTALVPYINFPMGPFCR